MRNFIIKNYLKITPGKIIIFMALLFAVAATIWTYQNGYIIAYGDAESHLNISKRVVSSLTPGFAQLGGIWLPLPHLLMTPFVYFDSLWRTGLAGSIVSGLSFVVAAYFLFKLTVEISNNKWAGIIASLVFIANPNLLYLQSTPMTELLLIAFFIISSYFFVKFIKNTDDIFSLIMSAFFTFCATLTRYDGWFLAIFQCLAIILIYFPWKRVENVLRFPFFRFDGNSWKKLQGRLILFGTLALLGIIVWLVWGYLILGDPLYFTHSTFSAKSQQQGWLARGELPAFHSMIESVKYYTVTAVANIGIPVAVAAFIGIIYFLFDRKNKNRFYILLILFVPFIFNVVTLFLGQSVIFIPSLTPKTFQWQLFNVRYGVMMIPLAAVGVAYLFKNLTRGRQAALVFILLLFQTGSYLKNYDSVLTFTDGVNGLSSQISKLPDAQNFVAKNYDGGLVLEDDFGRTLSIVRTKIPMKNVIYVGNQPYWEESLKQPQKYATWIVMQKDDSVWKKIYDDPDIQGRLYTYFSKVYTSPDILVFKRNEVPYALK